MRKVFGIISLMFTITLLSACSMLPWSSSDANADTNDEEINGKAVRADAGNEAEPVAESEADAEKKSAFTDTPPATTIPDIAEVEPGSLSGENYDEELLYDALDQESFRDKSAREVYNYLLSMIGEGNRYEEYYSFFESFNPNITTEVSNTPGGMQIDGSELVIPNRNVIILLDASKSMDQEVDGATKMQLAKESIDQFLADMPQDVNVMLRVYGSKGSVDKADFRESCSNTEVAYELQPYNRGTFKDALDSFKPTGWTPLARAISDTAEQLETGENVENILYVVSDGLETCGGDPIKAAENAHSDSTKTVINIIGFDIDREAKDQLQSVAEAGGGEFETVNNSDDFLQLWEDERQRLWSAWYDWENENWSNVYDEESEKSGNLLDMKVDVDSIILDEHVRLNDAHFALDTGNRLKGEIDEKVQAMINEREEILDDYFDNLFDSYKNTLDEQGDSLRDAINEKGDEMMEKYN